MKKITKQDVDYIVDTEKGDCFIVNRLEETNSTVGILYHLSNRKSKIFKYEEYEISEFDENLLN